MKTGLPCSTMDLATLHTVWPEDYPFDFLEGYISDEDDFWYCVKMVKNRIKKMGENNENK